MTDGDSAGRGVRAALGSELLAARRARDGERVGVQRALLAAIDNAGAVAAPQEFDATLPALGETEADRLTLDVSAVRQLFAAELRERELAADHYREVGQQDAADGLDRECRIIADYIERVPELSRTDPSA